MSETLPQTLSEDATEAGPPQSLDLHGRTVRFPADWTAETGRSDEGVHLELASGVVTFALVAVVDFPADPEDLAQQALDSLAAEHPGLEIEDLFSEGRLSAAVTREATFISLDTVSTAWVRAWSTDSDAVLVFVQTIEPEREMAAAAFDMICASLA